VRQDRAEVEWAQQIKLRTAQKMDAILRLLLLFIRKNLVQALALNFASEL